MSLLSALFEEDIEMQDAIEDIEDFADDSQDIILGAMEDRYNKLKEDEVHVLDDEEDLEVNDDGLTAEEETQVNMMMLNGLDDENFNPEDLAEDDLEDLGEDEADFGDED